MPVKNSNHKNSARLDLASVVIKWPSYMSYEMFF